MRIDYLRSVRFSALLGIGLLVLTVSMSGRLSAGETETLKVDDSLKVEGAGAKKLTTTALLQQFALDWPDGRTPYRTEGDTSWIAYALTMKRLVAQGDAAIPALLISCSDPQAQVRALSARVLGFLSGKGSKGANAAKVNTKRTQTVVAKLILLLDDSSPLVALMAADALGQLQDPLGLEALRSARHRIDHGDVLLHIAKGLQRRVPLEEDVREQILRIHPQQVNSAAIGLRAPDFTLRDAAGKAWKIADYRGKKSVVLVFIYGDG